MGRSEVEAWKRGSGKPQKCANGFIRRSSKNEPKTPMIAKFSCAIDAQALTATAGFHT
jgi:hypothetical protein